MKRPEKHGETVLEQTREIPVLDRTDVLVVGGGPAGLAAAIAAGRCISLDTVVHSCVRLIPPCLATGQAAGTAAAMAVAQGVTPREIDRSELQASLALQGARLS